MTRAGARARVTGVLALVAVVAIASAFYLLRKPSSTPRYFAVPMEGLDPAVATLISNTVEEVRQETDSGAAWGKLGSVLMHYDFVAQARHAFAQAERLSPDDARWPYLHGILLMTHDAEAAVSKLRRAVESAPMAPDMPRVRLAEFLSERGHTSEAQMNFEKLLRLNPDHPRALLGLARLSHQRGQSIESTNFLQRCLTNRHTARSGHVLLATVQRALGNVAMADSVAARGAMLPADRPWPDPYWEEAATYRVGRKALVENATALMDNGRTGEAVGVLTEVARTYPADDEAWYLMGWAFNQQGDWTEAEKVLREHLRLSPGSPKGHAQLAVALLNQKRYQEAIEVLENALKLKSTWRELHFNLGYACVQLGRTNEAMRHLRNALERDPAYAPSYTALAELLSRQGKTDEARRLLRQAAELYPADARVRALLQRVDERAQD